MGGGMHGEMTIYRSRIHHSSRGHVNVALRSQMLHLAGGDPQALSSFGHSQQAHDS
jgi:hypothetical protein